MHSIWAVATNTIKQALRMKVAAAFIILLMVLLPVMSVLMTGDGTLKGRLQSFVSYGLSLTSLLLCLLTIIVSIYSVTSDIEQRQIYTVITKPIRRYQFLLGKLLGVILLDVGLLVLFAGIIYAITICIPAFLGKVLGVILLGEASLVLFGAIIYAITIHIRFLWKALGVTFLSLALLSLVFLLVYRIFIYTPDLTLITESELAEANSEFFTARTGLTPGKVDVRQEVEETYEKLKKTGQIDSLFPGLSVKEIRAQLTAQEKLRKRAVPVGHQLVWEFDNVKPTDPNERLFIRFKYDVTVNPPDMKVYGRWVIGDVRQIKYGTKIETPIFTSDRLDGDLIRTFHEIEVPAMVVARDGFLGVGFINVPLNDTVVIFPLEGGLEVLYKADTFTVNYIRAVLLILFRLILLACLGILASTFLSFPVAILFCLVFFVISSFSSFFVGSFDYLSESVGIIYSYSFKWIIRLLPQFDTFNPNKFLVPGRFISWSLVGRAAGFMVCIKAFLLLVFALVIFSFREIAKIVV